MERVYLIKENKFCEHIKNFYNKSVVEEVVCIYKIFYTYFTTFSFLNFHLKSGVTNACHFIKSYDSDYMNKLLKRYIERVREYKCQIHLVLSRNTLKDLIPNILEYI